MSFLHVNGQRSKIKAVVTLFFSAWKDIFYNNFLKIGDYDSEF